MIPSRYLWSGSVNDRESYLNLHNELSSSLKKDGFLIVDLLPSFQKFKDPLSSFQFKYDGHWNKSGHLLAAQIIGNFLISLEEKSNK